MIPPSAGSEAKVGKKMTYALIQHGYGILSVGKTKQETIRNHSDDEDEVLDLLAHNFGHNVAGQLYLLPCTERLFNYVKEHGGDIAYDGPTWDEIDLSE